MKLSLKPLKNLTDNYHKADYKSGGNYQTSYYRFLEEGGTRPPEVRITHLPLTCDYILSTASIPFTIDVRTHNKIVGNIEVVTTLGESSHISYQLSNESYTFTFNANSVDVADHRGIEVTFTGLNKFEEVVTYSVNIPYEREADCYSLACESNSNTVTFKADSKSIYAFSINGRTYQVDSLSELQRIAEDNDLKISFYRKPLEWSDWEVVDVAKIEENIRVLVTKTNTEDVYQSWFEIDPYEFIRQAILEEPKSQLVKTTLKSLGGSENATFNRDLEMYNGVKAQYRMECLVSSYYIPDYATRTKVLYPTTIDRWTLHSLFLNEYKNDSWHIMHFNSYEVSEDYEGVVAYFSDGYNSRSVNVYQTKASYEVSLRDLALKIKSNKDSESEQYILSAVISSLDVQGYMETIEQNKVLRG